MWTPQPLDPGDLLELTDVACAVMRNRVPMVLDGDLEVDQHLGTLGATIALHLENLGHWVARALLRAGLVAVDGVVGRWPQPVRASAAALADVMPWSLDALVREAPYEASRLLEALRGYEDLAELIVPPDPPAVGRPGGWRRWCDRQEAIILAARS